MSETNLKTEALAIAKMALKEDAADHDVTTLAITSKQAFRARGILRAKQEGVLSGVELAEAVLAQAKSSLKTRWFKKNGDAFKPQDVLLEIEGDTGEMLRLERSMLNFLQQMSGVATLTQQFVKAIKPHLTHVIDTRKTVPGLRLWQKRAVVHGGGYNHRFDLSDQYLIKDNHLAAVGGDLARAIDLVKKNNKKNLPVIVEVTTPEKAAEASHFKVQVILLDNMSPASVKKSVALVGGRALVEVSGGLNLRNIKSYAAAGADRLSIGSLTHSASAIDLSFKLE